MIVNRSLWQATGQLWPVLAGQTSIEQLESDTAPPPRACECEHCPCVSRETEDDHA